MTQSLPDLKKALRARALDARRQAFAESGPEAAQALADRAELLDISPGTLVAGYWPLGDEIDPRPLMHHLASLGCRLALPVVAEKAAPLVFRAWAPGEVLEEGAHNTRHPLPKAPEVRPDLLLVPLVAFDAECFRLGYGGGYYDRTLESLRRGAHVRTIGLAFAAQRVDKVPRDGYDQRLDAIATETDLFAS